MLMKCSGKNSVGAIRFNGLIQPTIISEHINVNSFNFANNVADTHLIKDLEIAAFLNKSKIKLPGAEAKKLWKDYRGTESNLKILKKKFEEEFDKGLTKSEALDKSQEVISKYRIAREKLTQLRSILIKKNHPREGEVLDLAVKLEHDYVDFMINYRSSVGKIQKLSH